MGILNFTKFRVAVPKPKRKRNTDGVSRTSNKIIRGKVFQDKDGTYKVTVNMETNPLHPDVKIFDFTEHSYDLTGKTDVFSRTVDNKGRRIRFIRSKINAKHMPGLPEQYIPFAPNWIVRGYIVNDNGITKFDFKSLVGIDGYTMDVLHPEDD